LGGRAQLMASQFRQWRIRRARCRYRTFIPISGGTTLAGTSITDSEILLVNMAWFSDPTVAPIGWDNIKNDGAISFTLDRNSRWINIPPCGWKWFLRDPTTANYADFRSTLHGLLVAYQYDNSSATINALNWGFIEFEVDWQFRGYTDTNSDSAATTMTHVQSLASIMKTTKSNKPSLEERKSDGDDDSPGVLVGPARPLHAVSSLSVRVPGRKLPDTAQKKPPQ